MPKPKQPQKPAKRAKDKTKIKTFLKAKGHKVDALDFTTDEIALANVLKLHGVSAEQYRSGGVG